MQPSARDVVSPVDVLVAAAALHHAHDLPALLAALPRPVHDLIAHDGMEIVTAGGVLRSGADVAGLPHRLAVRTPGSGGAVAGLVLGRRDRAFDPFERTVAALLEPVLEAAVDHVRLRMLHAARPVRLEALTAREREVITLVADGRTTRDIAAVLDIEAATVEKHVEHIRAKLGARSRAEAAAAWARSTATA